MSNIFNIVLAIVGLIANILTLWSYGSGKMSSDNESILGSPFIIISISLAVIIYMIFLFLLSFEQHLRKKRKSETTKTQRKKSDGLGVVAGLLWFPIVFIWVVASWNMLPSDPSGKRLILSAFSFILVPLGGVFIRDFVLTVDLYINDEGE